MITTFLNDDFVETERARRGLDEKAFRVGHGIWNEAELREEIKFIAYLARDVLGYRDLTSLHFGWFAEILRSLEMLHLAPRDHFKTTCFSIVYPIYRILKDRTIKILLIHEILDSAKAYLNEIKGHFQSPRFREAFGDYTKNAARWTATGIDVSDRPGVNPTISVAGTMGAIQSRHCGLIVIDDPVSQKNSQTLLQRRKLFRWLLETLMPILLPDGQILMTGTRWHHDDTYGEILKPGRFKGWKKVVLRAEYEDGRILFPERWSREALAKRREVMGDGFYKAQYLNDPSGLEGQKFKVGWLKFYVTEPARMRIYQGIDLAISKKDRAAYFALVTIGIPAEGDIYVLDVVREKLDFPEQCDIIKRKCKQWKPIICKIENNAYQDSIVQWLNADPEARRLPIQGLPTYGEKEARLTGGLSPLFVRGVIKMRENDDALIDEFLAFPGSGTFDILDALLLAIEASRGQEVEPNIIEVNL